MRKYIKNFPFPSILFQNNSKPPLTTLHAQGSKSQSTNKKSTIDPTEVANFAKIGEEWWNKNGVQKMLHLMNGPRTEYIYSRVCDSIDGDFSQTSILDVGCGGGLLSENLSRLGANVTGIDVSHENIAIAEWHKSIDPILSKKNNLHYKMIPIEDIAETEHDQYDVVVSLEVLEHVSDPTFFIQSCQKVVKPGGHLFLSTINRNAQSYLLGILAAEYLLKWLPIGTHDHSKFITPRELTEMIHQDSNFSVQDTTGLSFHILNGEWYISDDVNMNYIIHARKNL